MNDDARSDILDRIKAAVGAGREPGDAAERARTLEGRVTASREIGVRATMPEDLVTRFRARAEANLITVHALASPADIPAAVAKILAQSNMAPDISVAPSLRDLAWPATMAVQSAKARITEKLTVSRAAAGIAETGTAVMCSGNDAPSSLTFAPEVNVVVVDEADIVAYLEDGLARVKTRYATWPRTVNYVSGPSRTADVAGIVVRPAHGPKSVHLLLISERAKS